MRAPQSTPLGVIGSSAYLFKFQDGESLGQSANAEASVQLQLNSYQDVPKATPFEIFADNPSPSIPFKIFSDDEHMSGVKSLQKHPMLKSNALRPIEVRFWLMFH